MYGVLHADNIAHTVDLVSLSLKDLNNISVFIEPLNPYELHGVRVFDSSSFRMVVCFFDHFYVTVGDMRVSLYDAVLFRSDDADTLWLCDFSPAEEGVNSGPGGCSTRSSVNCEAWEENNYSTSSWRLTSVRKRQTL